MINDKKFIKTDLTKIKFKKDTKYNIEYLLKNMEDINGKKFTETKNVKKKEIIKYIIKMYIS